MAEVEFERKIRTSRRDAGERLIALGTALVAGAKVELHHEADSIQFTVADELDWEFELEIDGDDVEVEIELKWSSRAKPSLAKPRTAAKKAAPAKPRTAARKARG